MHREHRDTVATPEVNAPVTGSKRALCRLSFEDELHVEDSNTTVRLHSSARHCFAADRSDAPAAKQPTSSLGSVAFGVATARGARPYMEDRHCCMPLFIPTGSNGTPMEDGVTRYVHRHGML